MIANEAAGVDLVQAQREAVDSLRVHHIELELHNDELRRILTALSTADARYFDFYELAPVGYATVDERATIIQANGATADLLGLSHGEPIGKALPGFMSAPDANRFFLMCRRVLASSRVHSCELQMLQASGNTIWVELQAIAVIGEVGASVVRLVLSDITARKHLEERLLISEASSQALLDEASDAIFIVDAAGHYKYVNIQATRLLGFSCDEMLSMNFREITVDCDMEATEVLFQQLRDTGVLRYERTLKRRDGSAVCVELNCRVLTDGRIFSACRDISDRKEAESQQRDNNKFRDAVLDSVPSQIAILDETGMIVAVNRSWREFALANSAVPGQPAHNTQIGVSYLDICNSAQGGTSSEGAVLAGNGVLNVIRGTIPVFRFEYPCHSPSRQQWFVMNVTPLGVESSGAVVIHTDITERRRSQEQLLTQAVDAEVASSRKKLREMAAYNSTVIEEERKHIAREVHDELGQVLTALLMEIRCLKCVLVLCTQILSTWLQACARWFTVPWRGGALWRKICAPWP